MLRRTSALAITLSTREFPVNADSDLVGLRRSRDILLLLKSPCQTLAEAGPCLAPVTLCASKRQISGCSFWNGERACLITLGPTVLGPSKICCPSSVFPRK